MGLPPASPRFKFVHTHPGSGSNGPAMPRRPPRQQLPSPSARSCSLELLDQEEEEGRKMVSTVVMQARPPLPRPRSRSLDGLLDEDAKSCGEPCEQDTQKSRSHLMRNSEEKEKIVAVPELGRNNSNAIKTVELENDPVPVPRMKPKATAECKSEAEDAQTSLDDKDESEKETVPTRPPKPSRRSSSSEGQSSTTSGKQFDDQKQWRLEEPRAQEMTQERLIINKNENEYDYDENNDHNDRSTMLKAKSCGAGLDSDGSVSSSEYGSRASGPKQGPGSLLSLPAGAEPKRKRNFMDKCVNKVRSFMRK